MPPRLVRLTAFLQRPLRAWPALGLSAVSGAVLALTLPPLWFWPGLVGYSGLLFALERGSHGLAGRAAVERRLWIGAAFGFAYHLAGLWWLGAAFLVDAAAHAVLLPIAVVGLPLLLALFHALAAGLTALAPSGLAGRAIALAAALSFTEWLRSFVFTGFPWNAAGIALTEGERLTQTAAVVGLAGLAVPAILLGALPILIITRDGRKLAGLTVAICAMMALYGTARLMERAASRGPVVKVVQPNIAQADKWEASERLRIWHTLLDLTRDDDEAAIVIWPETAIPFLWRPPSIEQAELAEALNGRSLLTGAVELPAVASGGSATNSLLLIGADGTVGERYDKVHLVPFGEYLPFAGVLNALGLEALAAGSSVFHAGTERSAIEPAGLPPLEPLICYEVIFSSRGVARAHWLVNVTNDAWFGRTAGPYQHFAHARVRAVERGLPLVRAANTGISAMIDAHGRVREALSLGVMGSFTAPLPPRTVSAYAYAGDWPLIAMWVAILAVLVHARAKNNG